MLVDDVVFQMIPIQSFIGAETASGIVHLITAEPAIDNYKLDRFFENYFLRYSTVKSLSHSYSLMGQRCFRTFSHGTTM